jgi:amino acid transporter
LELFVSTRSSAARFSVADALRANRLGTSSLVFFAVAAAAPLTVIAGGVSTGYADTGFPGIPAAYAVMAVILLLWSVGYTTLARHIVTAGSLYAYIARGLGPRAGLAAAGVALLAYPVMHIGLVAGFGAVFTEVLQVVAGADVPWWVGAFAGLAAIAFLGTRKVDLSGWVLGVLLLGEVAVVLVYDLVMLTHPHQGHIAAGPLSPLHIVATAGGFVALVGVTASFTGIELPTVMAEEAKDPRRTVARATRAAVLLTGALYAGSAWALTVATGPDNIQTQAKTHGPQLIFELVSPYVLAPLVQLGQLLFLTSLFAAALAFHATAARYLYALGREGVLPPALGAASRHTGAPARASLVHSLIAATVLVGYLAAGLDDPLTHLLFWGTVAGGFGVLILMTATSAAVLAYFHRTPFTGETAFHRRVAPAISGLLLAVVLVASLDQIPILLSVDPGSPARWVIPGGYLVAAMTGLGWAIRLHQARPDVLAQVGRGADATPAAVPAHP